MFSPKIIIYLYNVSPYDIMVNPMDAKSVNPQPAAGKIITWWSKVFK